MFFGTKSPVSTVEKVLLENEFQRLVDRLGSANLSKQSTLLANDPRLDWLGEADSESANRLKCSIASIFEIEDDAVGLEFGDEESGFVLGNRIEANRVVAQIDHNTLFDNLRLTASVVSACSTKRAIDLGLVSPEEATGYTIELLSVWYGFGPLKAEAAIRTSHYNEGGWSAWSMSRIGTLSALQLGYVMAIREFVLKGGLPHWHKQLNVDAKSTLAKAVKHFDKTGDFLVDEADSCLSWDEHRCLGEFDSKFASRRLAALMYFPFANDELSNEEIDVVVRATRDKDASVRQRGYELLEFAVESSGGIVRAVEVGMDDSERLVQAAAIRASGIHGIGIANLKDALAIFIDSNDRQLMLPAAVSIAANDLCDVDLTNTILGKVQRSLIRGSDDAPKLIEVLRHVSDDAENLLMNYFQNDVDLRHSVAELLESSVDHPV